MIELIILLAWLSHDPDVIFADGAEPPPPPPNPCELLTEPTPLCPCPPQPPGAICN